MFLNNFLATISNLLYAFNEANSVVNKYLILIYGSLVIYLIFLAMVKKKIVDSRHCGFLSYHLWAVPILTFGIMLYKVISKLPTIIGNDYQLYIGFLVHFTIIEALLIFSFVEWWMKNVKTKSI
jgi:hypothetical protein